MKKSYTSPFTTMANTRLRATILAGSNLRPDGTSYPKDTEGISQGGSTKTFDARIRPNFME